MSTWAAVTRLQRDFALMSILLLVHSSTLGWDDSTKQKNRSMAGQQYSSSWRVFWANNIRTFVNNNGVVFADTSDRREGLFWPGSTTRALVFKAGLWISGRDNHGDLRTALSYYKSFYRPGRINGQFADTNYSIADPPSDSRFKVLMLSDTTTASDPEYQAWISDSPVTGAPLDKDGKPLRLGKLNAYWLMNDLDTTFVRQFLSREPRPMGMEIANYTFAFDDGGVLSDVIFLIMDIRNKSVHTYDSTYLGWWSDIDLGLSISNYPGCDSTQALGYMYSALDNDPEYGKSSPSCGFVMLESPTVLSTGRAMTSYMKNVDQAGTPYVLPQPLSFATDSQFAFVLGGRLLDGTPLVPPSQPGNLITYVNPGDPFTQTGWLATQDFGGGTDCKMLQGSGPFILAPGDSVRLVLAFIVAQDTSRLSSVRKLKESVPAVLAKWNSLTAVASEQDERLTPDEYCLEQNYPNPFNPTTTIRYTIAGTGGQRSGASHVRLSVYDMLGREVAVLVNEKKAPGTYQVQFNASGLSSGVYVYRLTAGNFFQTRKMLLLQ